jgi:hypothetical protein
MSLEVAIWTTIIFVGVGAWVLDQHRLAVRRHEWQDACAIWSRLKHKLDEATVIELPDEHGRLTIRCAAGQRERASLQ